MEFSTSTDEKIINLMTSRQIFEAAIRAGSNTNHWINFTTTEAESMIAQADIAPHYVWLKGVEPAQICSIMSEVEDFRRAYRAENGRKPSDGRTYAAFRIAEDSNEHEADGNKGRAQILEALMGGDVKNGKLPEFKREPREIVKEIGVQASTIDIML